MSGDPMRDQQATRPATKVDPRIDRLALSRPLPGWWCR
jgi:hypothetical protein